MTVHRSKEYVLTACACIFVWMINFYSQRQIHLLDGRVSEVRLLHSASSRRQSDSEPEPEPEMPREGFLITMHNESGWLVAKELQRAFEIERMHVVLGHVGEASRLPMYNRYVMQTGRTDDLQIGNLKMLGCMETHREIWSRVAVGKENASYVFEHDAKPNENSRTAVKNLLRSLARGSWSVLLLQVPTAFSTQWSAALAAKNQFLNFGKLAQTCDNCIAYGSRGYLVSKAGAEVLLDNYSPANVQVDGYMSLLNIYNKNFTLIWTRLQVVDWIVSMTTQQELFEIHALNSWLKQKKTST